MEGWGLTWTAIEVEPATSPAMPRARRRLGPARVPWPERIIISRGSDLPISERLPPVLHDPASKAANESQSRGCGISGDSDLFDADSFQCYHIATRPHGKPQRVIHLYNEPTESKATGRGSGYVSTPVSPESGIWHNIIRAMEG